MSYGELGYREDIARSLGKGWILDNDKRMVSFRVKTLQLVFDDLETLVGAKVAKTLLYRMGRAVGRDTFSRFKGKVNSTEGLRTVLDEAMREHGWGRCVGLTATDSNEIVRYSFSLTDTITSFERTAPQPTCHLMRGLVAGWTEAYIGLHNTSSSEDECTSMGKQRCLIRVEFSHHTMARQEPSPLAAVGTTLPHFG